MHAPSSVVALTAAAVIAAALMTGRAMSAARPEPAPLPQRLSDTGLFEPGTATPRAGVLAFAPQYPLWSDGSRKRRWIALPPGTAIDAAKLDAWEFPVGTQAVEGIRLTGERIETRYIERLADGSWRFATYVWNAAGTDATLAPEDGVVVESPARRAVATSFLRAAIAWRATKVRRSRSLASVRCNCHGSRSARAARRRAQRCACRSASSPRAAGCATCRGVCSTVPPRIAAPSPTARAALGYLHGNCGHCHNAAGALTGLELVLAQQADPAARSSDDALQSLLGHSSRFRPQEARRRSASLRVATAKAS